jgi:murein DD-endopeptidase MepM/ murein hydrolase activator NlpD
MLDRCLLYAIILMGSLLSGCTPLASSTFQGIGASPSSQEASRTNTPKKTATITLTPSVVVEITTPTPYKLIHISSPLKDIDRGELGNLITNPFEQPPPGSDSGHHGVDFSFYRYKGISGIEGLPVLSIIDGQVAAILPDRFPYGNAVIIETPLTWIPDAWQTLLGVPILTPTPGAHILMTCPDNLSDPSWQNQSQSLYILYAHLQQPATLLIGEQVVSGQSIAMVGNTGGSVNPHLHVELRIGPSGVQFSSMSHYRGDTTDEERRNYCVWRVSGIFSLINPLTLLTIPGD